MIRTYLSDVKKFGDCVVCGTYGFSQTEVKSKPKGGTS